MMSNEPQFQGRYGPQYGDPTQTVLAVGKDHRYTFAWRPGWPNVVISLWEGRRQARVLVETKEFLGMSHEIANAILTNQTSPIVEDSDE